MFLILLMQGANMKIRNHYLSCKALSVHHLKTSDGGKISTAEAEKKI